VSANPTGPLHVGHCRGAILGDVISNLLKFNNQEVVKEYYVNDHGNQILHFTRSVYLRIKEKLDNQTFPVNEDDLYPGEYIKDIAQHIIDNNKDLNIPLLNGYLGFKSYHFERIRSGEISSVVSKVIDSKVVSTLNEKDVRYDDNSKLDRLTAQIFGYALGEININDKGRERKYTFRHIRDDKIKTIFGDTNVKIIKKDIVNNKRSSLIWYSTDNNHLPVMIEQYRLDKLMFRATLKSFED